MPSDDGPAAPVVPTYYDAASDTDRPITQEHVDDWQRNLQAHAMFRTGLIALQNACDAVARGEVAVWSVRDLINQANRDMPQKAD
jgi:hypothetical protein